MTRNRSRPCSSEGAHMQTQELTITRREGTGKQLAKRLRRNGVVPAVLYGGAKPETVTVDPRAVLRIIHGHEGSTQLLTLKFEGDSGSRMAIIRDLQFDPVSERLLHVDLQEVTADRAITVRVAVHPVGEAAGVKEQKGILNVVLHELDVSCLPTRIPARTGRTVGRRRPAELTQPACHEPRQADASPPRPTSTSLGEPVKPITAQGSSTVARPVVARTLRHHTANPAELILVSDHIHLR